MIFGLFVINIIKLLVLVLVNVSNVLIFFVLKKCLIGFVKLFFIILIYVNFLVL